MHPVMEPAVSSSAESVLARFACHFVGSPFFWWAFVVLSFYLMERFEVGTHLLSWSYWRKRKINNHDVHLCEDSIDGPMMKNHSEQITAPHSHSNGVAGNGVAGANGFNRTLPPNLQEFLHSYLMPTFRMQRSARNTHGKFAVLVFSHINSTHDLQELEFRQVTFKTKPLIDSARSTYPEAYRFDNYVVAQSTESEHPEALIASKVPLLLAAFAKAERCYVRHPVPRTAILYCQEMPCSVCTGLLVESLSGVCRNKTILAYSEGDTEVKDGKKSVQRLVEAGISVFKIDA